jgi:hypothetical protein
MNNEKIQALFESIELLIDEQKKATNELNDATTSAKKIKSVNNKEKNITKIINDFNLIKTNTENLEKKTNDAILRMQKQARFPKIISLLLTYLFFALFGLGTGYYVFTTQTKNYAYKLELESKYNIDILSNAIVLPTDYRVLISDDGQNYLPQQY